MIRHALEVFLLVLAAFAVGTIAGVGLRLWWGRRARPVLASPIPVPVPVGAAAPERRRPVAAPPKAAAAASAAPAAGPSAARALVPVRQRPQQLARLSSASRSGVPAPASIDGRRLFQAHLKAATERRDQSPAGARPAAPPGTGTALARPTNARLKEIDLTAIRRQPQRTLPPPRPAKAASLPIILPSVRSDDVWNDEPPRSPPSPPGSKPDLRELQGADDPWDTPSGWQIVSPPSKPRQSQTKKVAPPQALRPVARMNGILSDRPRDASPPPASAELPAIAAPRSDQIWIEAARADAGLPPLNGSVPDVRASYRSGGQRPPCFDEPPPSRDNLRRIRGVGQGFEKRLNELGIYKFSQVAAWTDAEQQWVSDQLGFPGRVERDDWPAQARRLLQRRRPESALAVDAEIVGDA